MTLARDLRRRKAREGRGLFTIEGTRAVEEVLRSPLTLRGVLHEPGFGTTERETSLLDALSDRGVEILRVDPGEFRSAADTEQPQGILAIAEIPRWSLDGLAAGDGSVRLLVLDAIQDPGNMGTIIRTAAALGSHGAIALPGTVDPWNAKVVRSGMGASFRFPVVPASLDQLRALLAEREIPLWAAEASGEPVDGLPAPRRLALTVGNEGAGLSPDVLALAARRVALPIAPDVESLNVAVATGILLYVLRP